jgi:hypothetical protein
MWWVVPTASETSTSMLEMRLPRVRVSDLIEGELLAALGMRVSRDRDDGLCASAAEASAALPAQQFFNSA